MQKIVPFLCFNDKAEEAVEFYLSVFKNAKIVRKQYCGESVAKATNHPKGSLLAITFQLEGQDFIALNVGPDCEFTKAISLLVTCKDQAEVDELWKKLSANPQAEVCGWLQDKFGVTWQIVPPKLLDMTHDKDLAKADRVMAALMRMKKLDGPALEKAYKGGDSPN